MQHLPNLHAIEVKFLGPTNANGSRVRLTSARFEQSKTIPYDHRLSSITDMAQVWLSENGFNVLYQAESKDGYLLLTDTFEPLKK